MIEILRARRSIRKFTDQPVDSRSMDLLVETLLRSPSSRNINPWHFVVVDDRELLGALSKAKVHGSTFLSDAPLGIVICADSTLSDVWVEDCSIASILVQMTAQSLGLGSCWIQIRNRHHAAEITSEAYIRQLLGLPGHIAVESIIAIGHPAEQREPLAAASLQREKVTRNRFSIPF